MQLHSPLRFGWVLALILQCWTLHAQSLDNATISKPAWDPYSQDWQDTLAWVSRDFQNTPSISTDELATRLARTPAKVALILDVREAAEYKESHIPGALHAPDLQRARRAIASLPPEGEVIVYCSVGYRSARLISQLNAEAPNPRVYNLTGSIFKWANEGRELTNTKGTAKTVHPYDATWGRLLRPELNAQHTAPEKRSSYRGLIAFVGLVLFLLWETMAPFFPFFRKKSKERMIHGFKNLVIGWINAAIMAVLFVSLWQFAAQWSADYDRGLLYRLNLPPTMHIIVGIMLIDLWTYWWHRACHRIPVLWRFHRVHHSDPHMDVTSANRFHLGEIICSSLLRVPVIIGIGLSMEALLIYETMLLLCVQFHHANIALPVWLEKNLRWVFVTPGMHKVHHSRHQPETDSNYTSLFSWWDRVFKTLTTKDNLNEIKLGLTDEDGDSPQRFKALMLRPFRK